MPDLVVHQPFGERALRAAELALLHRAPHLEAEGGEVGDGLGQVVEGADLHGLDGGLDAGVAGDEDDLQFRLHLLELAREREPGVGAEVLVHQRNGDVAGPGVLERFRGAVGGEDLAIRVVEKAAEHLHHDALVVHHENPGLAQIRTAVVKFFDDRRIGWRAARRECGCG